MGDRWDFLPNGVFGDLARRSGLAPAWSDHTSTEPRQHNKRSVGSTSSTHGIWVVRLAQAVACHRRGVESGTSQVLLAVAIEITGDVGISEQGVVRSGERWRLSKHVLGEKPHQQDDQYGQRRPAH